MKLRRSPPSSSISCPQRQGGCYYLDAGGLVNGIRKRLGAKAARGTQWIAVWQHRQLPFFFTYVILNSLTILLAIPQSPQAPAIIRSLVQHAADILESPPPPRWMAPAISASQSGQPKAPPRNFPA